MKLLMCVLWMALLMGLTGAVTASESSAVQLSENPEIKGAIAVVDAWVDGVRAYADVPGISVGVVADQDLLFAKGYGLANRRRKVPADEDTIYSICSISKLFTSISVMQMRDAGKLALRDPVRRHLPWFAIEQHHQGAGPARIHGLLTHSSGLPREVDFPYWVNTDFPFPDRPSMIAQIARQQTLYPADSLFQYSNLGLTLAGEIVAELAGQPYREYVEQNVLAPLSMNDTRPYFPRDLHGKQMAIGYSGLGRERKRKPVPPFDTKAVTPAAGFTSTVADLAKFASWQFRLLGNNGDHVLDANTLREMHRVHWVDPDWKTSWGLGFVVANAEGTTVVAHGGGCPGYITSLQLVPKQKLAAIVLTNAGDGPANNIASNVLRTFGPVLKAARSATAAAATADPKAPAGVATAVDLQPYVGNYGGSIWGGEVAIRVWDDKLVALDLPSESLKDLTKLKWTRGDEFVRLSQDGEPREPWVFQRDDNGLVTGILRHSQISKRLH